MSGLRYVYAVCRPLGAPLQAQLTGVAGDPPRLLHHHGLVAVVSHVPERDFAEEPLRARLADPDWAAATTRAHQGVIDALTVVTTPLPLRCATVFRDDSGVRTMLEAREADFRRTLDRLEGRVEWGVTVDRRGGAASSGDRYGEEFGNRVHRALSAVAEDFRLHSPGTHVLDAAYLVRRVECEKFVEQVGLLNGTEGGTGGAAEFRVELDGPWAAYSFTGERP
ncbi:GvpL/GvpF family gas vesicle protein [Streptomyces sp. NPDC090106]|uniref:GvpL/GvpF family gas vesicle protein n=1 Tax=Streptomyces sp. NPDC090106 TaxID=3365946 RepID=UPI00380A4541